jgi:hypothetical protein
MSDVPASLGSGCAAIPTIAQNLAMGRTPGRTTHAFSRSTALLPTTRHAGGYIFAEDPTIDAMSARLLWRADHDRGVLAVRADPAAPDDPDHVRLDALPGKTTLIVSGDRQHLLISDGAHQLRLDIHGTLLEGPVRLHYQLAGTVGIEAKLHTLRRLLALLRLGRFARGLEIVEPRVDRWVLMLRAYDLGQAGASQREIAASLFGAERVACEWRTTSDSLRLRVQRLLRDAAAMVDGGYLALLGGGRSSLPDR